MMDPHPDSWWTFHQDGKLRIMRVKRHTYFDKCQHVEVVKVDYLSVSDRSQEQIRKYHCSNNPNTALRVSTFYNSLLKTFAYCDKHGGILHAEIELAHWLEELGATPITARRARRLSRHRRKSSARQFMDIKFDD